MSIEEARKVTASFSGTPLVPPPRTIEDITAILDQQKPADPRAAAEARARADQQPPETTDAATLAKFYDDRAFAARHIGRGKQDIEDLTRALAYAQKGGFGDHLRILYDLGAAEIGEGSYSRGLEHHRALASQTRDRGWSFSANASVAASEAWRGNLREAEARLQQLAANFSEALRWWGNPRAGPLLREAQLARAQGAVAAARGQYADAEVTYLRTVAALAAHPVWSQDRKVNDQRADLAIVLVYQGKLLEAEGEARAALLGALRQQGRYASQTARSLRTLAGVIREEGRSAEAEKLIRAALDIHEKIGTVPESTDRAFTRMELAAVLAAQERWREALSEYETVRAALVSDPESLEKYLGGHTGWALALLRTGHADRALELLNVALERSKSRMGEKHRNTAYVRGLLATALVAQGDLRRATREFREATQVLLVQSFDVDDESATQIAAHQRLGFVLAAYIELLADIRGTDLERDAGIDVAAEAFRLADIVRGQAVERALDASAARAAAKTPALADLVRREQDAKKQMSALQGLVRNALSVPANEQDTKVIADLRTQIETLRRAREPLTQQIEREFPAHAQLVNPAPATLEQARANLRAGEALISILVGRNRTFVWAIPQSGPVAFAAVPMGAKALEAPVEKLRKALDPSAKTLGEIPDFDVATAHDLYRALLEPVVAGWQGTESLLVVAHGPLGQLPFSLLVTRPTTLGKEQGALFSRYRDVPWLVRRHAVTVLPSIGALVTLRRLPPADPARRPFVGFGDPYFSQDQARQASIVHKEAGAAQLGSRGVITLRNLTVEKANSTRLAMLPRLPDTADEIRGIALAMGADARRDVFLGVEANERRVKTLDLAAYRVIAFATHGLVPGDLDGLMQPALALTAPEVANVEGDGLLTMEEILALRLNADWVVLSACNTASGQGAGSEAISGLGRAFFHAGARALLVSNWPVETTSARALTTELFRRQAVDHGLSRAQALRQTMNALIDEGGFVDPATNRPVFSYAHPIFWAPFTLIGDGG